MSHPITSPAAAAPGFTQPAGASRPTTHRGAGPGIKPYARSAAFAAGLLLVTSGAWAGPPWLCSLSDEATRLVCVVDRDEPNELASPTDPSTPARARPAAGTTTTATSTTTAQTTRVVNGTTFPLDQARVYTVELFAPATEREWVEQLARATICYRSPGCEVVVVGMDDPASAAAPARSSTTVARLTSRGS